MAIDNILLAIGPHDEERASALADAVAEVAGPLDVPVVLAHVFEEGEFEELRQELSERQGTGTETTVAMETDEGPAAEMTARISDWPGSDIDVNEVARRLSSVREVASQLRDAGVEVEIRGEVGRDRSDAIVSLAREVGADRVFVGGRRRSPTGKAIFGSTAQQVMLSAPCPVTYVRVD